MCVCTILLSIYCMKPYNTKITEVCFIFHTKYKCAILTNHRWIYHTWANKAHYQNNIIHHLAWRLVPRVVASLERAQSLSANRKTRNFLAKAQLLLYTVGTTVVVKYSIETGSRSASSAEQAVNNKPVIEPVHYGKYCTLDVQTYLETKCSTWLRLVLYLPLDPSLVQYFP